MGHIKALLLVSVISVFLYFLWNEYRDFLTQGSRPSQSMLKLKDMEINGAPPFSIKDIHGDIISLSHFKDRVVILNFWASWCEPCVDELPSMMELIDRFQGELILIAVSADENLEDMRSFLMAFQVDSLHIKVIWDKDMVLAKKYGTEVLPESYIFGKNNHFHRKVSGELRWDSPEAILFFKKVP